MRPGLAVLAIACNVLAGCHLLPADQQEPVAAGEEPEAIGREVGGIIEFARAETVPDNEAGADP